jgi:hypothetical protein
LKYFPRRIIDGQSYIILSNNHHFLGQNVLAQLQSVEQSAEIVEASPLSCKPCVLTEEGVKLVIERLG